MSGQPGMGSVEVMEAPVELGFEGGMGPSSDLLSWGQAEGKEVASEEQGLRGGASQIESIGDAPDGLDGGRGLTWARGASESVGGHHQAEVLYRLGGEAAGQAADGTFAGFLEMGHVLKDERDDAFGNGPRYAEPFKERGGEPGAVVLMAGRNDSGTSIAQDGMGAGGLAEVVGQDGEGDDDAGGFVGIAPGREIGEGVEGVAGVLEDVAFRVPFGFLGHASEGIEFGKMGEPAGGLDPAKAGGRDRARCGPFEPFVADAFEGEFMKGADQFAAAGQGFGRAGQVKAPGELHAAEDAQGIIAERFADVAQDPALDIIATAEEVEDLTGPGVPHEGVEGEVTSGGCLGRGDVGIEVDVEAAVAGADFGIAAGDAEVVDGIAEGELDDTEGAADEIGTAPGAEGLGEGLVGGAKDLDIEVLQGASQDGIPDTATDEVGTPQDGKFAEQTRQISGKREDHPGTGVLGAGWRP